MKKLGILIGGFAALAIAFAGAPDVNAASAAPNDGGADVCTMKTVQSIPTFFANGTPITIDGDSTNTTITWTENGGGTCSYASLVPAVAGGYYNDSEPTTTSITMLGGVVAYLNGGGVSEGVAGVSKVTSADINILGGRITRMLSAGGTDYTTADLTTSLSGQSANTVESATITVSPNVANTISGTFPNRFPIIYAGGDWGYSYVGSSTINVNGGDWARIVGGGSAGYVGTPTVNMTDGYVELLQGVNRGCNGVTNINVTGGTIDDLYIAADAAVTSQSVCTVQTSASADISGTAKVDNVYAGYELDGTLPDSLSSLSYVYGTVANVHDFDLTNSNTKMLMLISIDGAPYYATYDERLDSNSWYKAVTTRDGFVFKGFKDSLGNIVNGDLVISANNDGIELDTQWEAIKAATTNPQTSDNIMLYAALGLVGLAGIAGSAVLINKKN